MKEDKTLKPFAGRVGYAEADLGHFQAGDPRQWQINELAQVEARYFLVAAVIKVRHCHSGYRGGDRFVLDVEGQFPHQALPRPLVCLSDLAALRAGGPDQRALQRGPGPQALPLHAPGALSGRGSLVRRLRRSNAVD